MMHNCEAQLLSSGDHDLNQECEPCHPTLRTRLQTDTPEIYDENCVQKYLPCNSCCTPEGQQCLGASCCYEQPFESKHKEAKQDTHLHSVSHSCPLGKINCYVDCTDNDCKGDEDLIKAADLSRTQERIISGPDYQEIPALHEETKSTDRSCCEKRASWTEPRICRCEPFDPVGDLKRCECECGAAIFTPQPTEQQNKKGNKKRVHFADEVTTYEDRERVFRDLNASDVQHLCSCCKECAITGKYQCIGRPVLVYELPQQKFDGTSVTHDDFCWQKIPRKEIPPWHPNIKDRWHHMEVPSITETTYQSDYRPPPVINGDRKPVYLAPQREKIDPCQQLAEEYCTWKKTSTGDNHVYHSSCDSCDKDLHRVHLHDCEVAHLPPQFQCHGDGHICQPSSHTTGEKFAMCEMGDGDKSRYWFKRTCGEPPEKESEKLADLPLDLKKPACPSYVTSYKHDFKNPKIQKRVNVETCRACEYCRMPPPEDQPNLLCTKDTNQSFITQRAGVR